MAQMIVTKSDNQVIIRSPGPQGPQGATGNVLEGIGADESVMIADSGEGEGIRWAQVGDANVSALSPSKVTGTALVASLADAKGDLLAATGADTVGRLPVGADGGVLVADSGEASGIGWKSLAEADVARASTVGNLLPENVATGTDTLGTTSGFTFSACTGESSTEWAERGTRSLKITGTGSQPSVYTSPSTTTGALVDDDKAQYTVGYTLYVPSGSDFIGAPWRTFFYCYDAGGTVLATKGQVPYALVEGVNRGLDTFTVPAGTAYVRARIFAYGVSLYGTAYMDSIGIWKGAGGEWVAPGTPVPNMQGAAYVSSPASITLNRARPVLDATGTLTATLPTASDNTGVKFTLINSGTGTVTVSGITGLTIPGTGMVQVISDGTNWLVLQGEYTTHSAAIATTGKGSWVWDNAANSWRLVAYDSGWRAVTSWNSSGTVTGQALNAAQVEPRSGFAGSIDLRREIRSVHMRITNLSVVAPVLDLWSGVGLPAGFTPRAQNDTAVTLIATAANSLPNKPVGLSFGASDTALIITNAVAGDYWRGSGVAATWDAQGVALPTSLPGTQLTAPV